MNSQKPEEEVKNKRSASKVEEETVPDDGMDEDRLLGSASSSSDDDDEYHDASEVHSLKDPFDSHLDRFIPEKYVHICSRPKSDQATSSFQFNLSDSPGERVEFTIRNADKIDSFTVPDSDSYKIFCDIDNAQIRTELMSRIPELNLTERHRKLLSSMAHYKDLFISNSEPQEWDMVRMILTIHALDHVLKTRSKVVKNQAIIKSNHENKGLSKKNKKVKLLDDDNQEFRDQGLVRPKVLFIVPFRWCALKIVRTLRTLLFGVDDKVEVANWKRFNEEFGWEGEELADRLDPETRRKPQDFIATFTGNCDDSFRIGLTVTRKSLKLYSDFYSSDIIIGSPLGFRSLIGAEGEKGYEYDFLSSVQVLLIDQADIFLMQNWEHILYVMRHLNLQPTKSHGIDFSRVRLWELEGWGKYYRQLVLTSRISTIEIESFVSKISHNYEGLIAIRSNLPPERALVTQVLVQCPQIFRRINSKKGSTLLDAPMERFDYFVNEVLPQLRDPLMKQTLIFIPSYFDYIRVRNHLRHDEGNKTGIDPVSFTQVCEYTKKGKVAKARAIFFHGGRQVMLYTERFHYFYRYTIKGIRHLIFYQLPHYPDVYPELVNLLHPSYQGKRFTGDDSSFTSTVLYSKWDIIPLSYIVGSERAQSMLASDTSHHVIATKY